MGGIIHDFKTACTEQGFDDQSSGGTFGIKGSGIGGDFLFGGGDDGAQDDPAAGGIHNQVVEVGALGKLDLKGPVAIGFSRGDGCGGGADGDLGVGKGICGAAELGDRFDLGGLGGLDLADASADQGFEAAARHKRNNKNKTHKPSPKDSTLHRRTSSGPRERKIPLSWVERVRNTQNPQIFDSVGVTQLPKIPVLVKVQAEPSLV